MSGLRWRADHRRLIAAAVAGIAVAAIVAIFVSVPAAVALLMLVLFGYAFVWRAGYTSSVLTTWSRSRFEDGEQGDQIDWMGNVGKPNRHRSGKRRR